MALPSVFSRELFLWVLDNQLFTMIIYGVAGAVIFSNIGKLAGGRDVKRQKLMSKMAGVLGFVAGIALSTMGTVVDLAKNWLFLMFISIFIATMMWTIFDGFLFGEAERKRREITIPLAILFGALLWFAFGVAVKQRVSAEAAEIIGIIIIISIAITLLFIAAYVFTRPRRPGVARPAPARAAPPAAAPPRAPAARPGAPPARRPPRPARPGAPPEELPEIEAEAVAEAPPTEYGAPPPEYGAPPAAAPAINIVLDVLDNIKKTADQLSFFQHALRTFTPDEARQATRIKNAISNACTILLRELENNLNVLARMRDRLRRIPTYRAAVTDKTKAVEAIEPIAAMPPAQEHINHVLKAVAYTARAQMYILHCAAQLANLGEDVYANILGLRGKLDEAVRIAETVRPEQNMAIAQSLNLTQSDFKNVHDFVLRHVGPARAPPPGYGAPPTEYGAPPRPTEVEAEAMEEAPAAASPAPVTSTTPVLRPEFVSHVERYLIPGGRAGGEARWIGRVMSDQAHMYYYIQKSIEKLRGLDFRSWDEVTNLIARVTDALSRCAEAHRINYDMLYRQLFQSKDFIRALINIINRLDLPRSFNARSALQSYLGYCGVRGSIEGEPKEEVVAVLSTIIGETPPAAMAAEAPPAFTAEIRDFIDAYLIPSEASGMGYRPEMPRIGAYLANEQTREYFIRKSLEYLNNCDNWLLVSSEMFRLFYPFGYSGVGKEYVRNHADVKEAFARKLRELDVPPQTGLRERRALNIARNFKDMLNFCFDIREYHIVPTGGTTPKTKEEILAEL